MSWSSKKDVSGPTVTNIFWWQQICLPPENHFPWIKLTYFLYLSSSCLLCERTLPGWLVQRNKSLAKVWRISWQLCGPHSIHALRVKWFGCIVRRESAQTLVAFTVVIGWPFGAAQKWQRWHSSSTGATASHDRIGCGAVIVVVVVGLVKANRTARRSSLWTLVDHSTLEDSNVVKAVEF